MIYALLDRAKNAYFRFSFAAQNCAEIVYTRLLYFSMQTQCGHATDNLERCATFHCSQWFFQLIFFFYHSNAEQLKKACNCKTFRDNFRIS